jgi:phosphinothricin acetyltransferase
MNSNRAALEPTYVLRAATTADAAAIAEIYNESVAAGDATTDERPKSAEEVREIIRGFGRRETILILEGGGEVFGWGVIKRYSERPGYRFCCETSVYLRRQHVGRGYGTYLKKAMIERCRDYGYHHLVAKVFADNERSIDYNLKLGYERVGTQREIAYRAGRWRDVAILQLVLRDVPPEIPDKYA